jgi:hypothetical protein
MLGKSLSNNMYPAAIFCNPWMRYARRGLDIDLVRKGGTLFARKGLRVETPMESIALGEFGGGGNPV